MRYYYCQHQPKTAVGTKPFCHSPVSLGGCQRDPQIVSVKVTKFQPCRSAPAGPFSVQEYELGAAFSSKVHDKLPRYGIVLVNPTAVPVIAGLLFSSKSEDQ
ncbi:hypothetical protein BaRGS_00011860 [Batillaria attramentaria]|uniref:Uncharacterized protein n=1 Tax=Batillaria attramentaria TaxID=370345 RepID=A0ABD0LBX5_9CAEN